MMPSHTRRQIIQGAGVAAAGTIAGCSGSKQQTNKGTGGNSQTDTKTAIQQPSGSKSYSTKIAVSTWPAAPFGLTIKVAQAKGFFEKHNVSIKEFLSFGSGGNSVRGVTTGGIGIGMTAFNAAINAYDAGAPIQIVGNNTSKSIIDWVVRPNSDIKSIQDTKGATVAVGNSGSGSEALIYLMYSMVDGVSLDDIEILNTGGMTDSQTVLQDGKADVAYSSPPLTQMRVKSGKLKKAWATQKYIPNFTENVFIAGTPVIQKKPELIKGLLASAIDAHQFIKQNPAEAGALWGEEASFYSKDQTQMAVNYFLEELGKDYFDIKLEEEVVKKPAEALKIMGARKQEPPWDKVLNQSLLPESKHVEWLK